MERRFLHVTRQQQQPRQRPRIPWRMRVPPQVHFIAQKHVLHFAGMRRVNERVHRLREIDMIVALNRLIEKQDADDEDQRERGIQSPLPAGAAILHNATWGAASPLPPAPPLGTVPLLTRYTTDTI